jgi:hypothetical protein
MSSRTGSKSEPSGKPECFVIMPIGELEDYAPDHFKRVFNDIFTPACEIAGYRATLASEVLQTNFIHLEILQRLLESPMVLCDLSTHNPNVLFELGMRQAFDKPVVLVQEVDTPRIFDIAPLRYVEYNRSRLYHEVLADQKQIADAILATQKAHDENVGINSIVRLLSLTKPATIDEVSKAAHDPLLQIIRAELGALRSDLRSERISMQRALVGDEWLDPRSRKVFEKMIEDKVKAGHSDDRIVNALTPKGAPVGWILDVITTIRGNMTLENLIDQALDA